MDSELRVFTNGCFDILHIGHIKLLEFCRNRGRVIVGLNSDESIRKIKGSNRPINTENNRKMLLESLRFVDQVIIFEEITPYELIKKLRPDLIVKGGDYNASDVVGSDLAKVLIFPTVKGFSTTHTAQMIEDLNG